MPRICAHRCPISGAVAFCGVSLLSFSMHLDKAASVCPSCSDTPFCWGATVEVCLLPLVSALTCAARATSGILSRIYRATQGTKRHVLRGQNLVLRMLVQRKGSVAVEPQTGFSRLWDGAYSRFHCFDGEGIASQSKNDHGADVNYVPLWSYHWAFDGWRIHCDGSSTFSVCVSSELLGDGREGRTPMAWHFPV